MYNFHMVKCWTLLHMKFCTIVTSCQPFIVLQAKLSSEKEGRVTVIPSLWKWVWPARQCQLLAHYQISHRACEVFAQPSDWIHTACKSQRSTNNKPSCSQSVERPRRLTIGAVGSPFMNNTRGLSFISCVRIWVRIRQRWSSEKFVMWSPAYQKLKIQSVHVLTLWKCSFVYFWAPSVAL